MIAAFANSINPENPLDALSVGEIGEPHTPPDWVTVSVKSASLNHHDIWSLRGQALKADRVPMILGSDAAGVNRVFFLQLSINGSTMGSRADFVELLELLDRTGTKPVIDRVMPLHEAKVAFEAMLSGDVRGKLVLNP